MKIAVTSAGKDLTADVDPRFGRAEYFLIVDTETLDFEVVENQQNLNLPQGAGIQAGKNLINTGATVLITGNCGPKAFQVLNAGKIKIITGANGNIKDVIDKFKSGELKYSDNANVEGHWV